MNKGEKKPTKSKFLLSDVLKRKNQTPPPTSTTGKSSAPLKKPPTRSAGRGR